MKKLNLVPVLACVVCIFFWINPSLAEDGTTVRVSVASDGTQADGTSWTPAISANGQFVSFLSWASNLVPEDTSHRPDIFIHDLESGATERVSVSSDGTEGDGESDGDSSVSADGRYVAFISESTNLVPGDTNEVYDVFVRDRTAGTTERVSVSTNGTQGDAVSSLGDMSPDGRYVVFASSATNLVAGDTNGTGDIFIRDRQAGTTTRVSVAHDGSQSDAYSFSPTISADGRFVCFVSAATNLVTGDTNGKNDVFVYDRDNQTVERVSVSSNGTQGDEKAEQADISADGRYVAFSSRATNMVDDDTNDAPDIFVHDRDTDQTELVSLATDGTRSETMSLFPSISSDGRYVAFYSVSNELVEGDTNSSPDFFVRDRQEGVTVRVSVDSDGNQANHGNFDPPSISADGLRVAFSNSASNLVPDAAQPRADTNEVSDIFVRIRTASDDGGGDDDPADDGSSSGGGGGGGGCFLGVIVIR